LCLYYSTLCAVCQAFFQTFLKKVFWLCTLRNPTLSSALLVGLWLTFIYRTQGHRAVRGLYRRGLTRLSWVSAFTLASLPSLCVLIIAHLGLFVKRFFEISFKKVACRKVGLHTASANSSTPARVSQLPEVFPPLDNIIIPQAVPKVNR